MGSGLPYQTAFEAFLIAGVLERRSKAGQIFKKSRIKGWDQREDSQHHAVRVCETFFVLSSLRVEIIVACSVPL